MSWAGKARFDCTAMLKGGGGMVANTIREKKREGGKKGFLEVRYSKGEVKIQKRLGRKGKRGVNLEENSKKTKRRVGLRNPTED